VRNFQILIVFCSKQCLQTASASVSLQTLTGHRPWTPLGWGTSIAQAFMVIALSPLRA